MATVDTMARWVRLFKDGEASQRMLLGNKGANLAEMTRLGLPVPAGFTVTTEACRAYLRGNNAVPDGMWDEVADGLHAVEAEMGRTLGDPSDPLLLSIRSGGPLSMPGMMETVLNLGLNDTTIQGLIATSGDERFSYDSYRRLVQMYGKVVLGVPTERFEHLLAEKKTAYGAPNDAALPAEALRELVGEYKALVKAATGSPFPDDPQEQLRGAIEAVFRSWNIPRAINYRREYKLPDDLGTGVNVQAMVFGNRGDDCATGVAFTRNPATGEHHLMGEYLQNAQGEDVVSGIRTPLHIDGMAEDPIFARSYQELLDVSRRLEAHFSDAQDLEFTVEKGKFWILQTRTAKRTGPAAVRMAVEMKREGLIDERTAVQRVLPDQLNQLLHPRIDPDAKIDVLATGLAASPGAATGMAVFDPDEAEAMARDGKDVILVRRETSPDDFHGMVAARGIVTARGGTTSHAAVVARGMGKPCVAGAGDLDIHEKGGFVAVGDHVVRRLDWITIDGTTGQVIVGRVPMVEPDTGGDYQELLTWADKIRVLGVRANADTPEDAENAVRLGAEGIGLCRTEHMFFQGTRIQTVREMILADTEEERNAAIDRLLPLQKDDFVGIFRAMGGRPVTIRTLDPPLHEFLPHAAVEEANLAWQLGLDVDVVRSRVRALHEANPMLGFRGCRLGIAHPHITEMQAMAILSAAIQVTREGIPVKPEIMVPLVATPMELKMQREVIDGAAKQVFEAEGMTIEYHVGTMIELPRAALLADKIAEYADFISFGTNDLTQTTLGISRDDAGRFLPMYIQQGILPHDPFVSLDIEGVGKLVEMGATLARKTKPEIKIGVCGEAGGDPASIEALAGYGLNYVSCSPFRVPIARLATAHAVLDAPQVEGSAG